FVSGANGMFEQIVIEPARTAAAARRECDHDAVDIDKTWIARVEPEEIRAVISGVLIEREQESVEVSNPPCQEGLAYEMLQPRRLQPRQLSRMGVVEREQTSSQRLRRRYFVRR